LPGTWVVITADPFVILASPMFRVASKKPGLLKKAQLS